MYEIIQPASFNDNVFKLFKALLLLGGTFIYYFEIRADLYTYSLLFVCLFALAGLSLLSN